MSWNYDPKTNRGYFDNSPTKEFQMWLNLGNKLPKCTGKVQIGKAKYTDPHEEITVMPAKTNAFPHPYNYIDGYIGFECSECGWLKGPDIRDVLRQNTGDTPFKI